MAFTIESGGLRLSAHLARPPEDQGRRPGLVLCHGFPAEPRGSASSGETYAELADRLAADTGWTVLTFNFRGTGDSEGDFSLAGWLADLETAIDVLLLEPVDAVYVAGFSAGGAVALCVAAEDERVAGVAAFAAPGDFGDWADDPVRFLEHARHVGVVQSRDFPDDLEAWTRELREIRAVAAVAKVPPRPILLVQGSDDDVVPVLDARTLADAAGEGAELRVLTGAGHRLRHDPRAIAVLIGWMERHAAAPS